MRKLILILSALVSLFAFADESPALRNRFAGGTGLEGRSQQDINPGTNETRALPHFFVQYHRWPYGVSLEGQMEQKDTSSGALKIESQSLQIGAWGRYGFLKQFRASPYADVGAGYFVDTVTSHFNSETDTRNGRRGFFGFGGGVSHAFWNHMLLEAEMRAALIQDRKEPAYSAILRIGYVL